MAEGDIHIHFTVADDPELSFGAKFLFGVLDSYAGKGKVRAWPSQELVAQRMGVKKRQVQNLLTELIARKHVHTVPRSIYGRGNVYVLNYGQAEFRWDEDGQTQNIAPDRRKEVRVSGAKKCAQNYSQGTPLKEPSPNPTGTAPAGPPNPPAEQGGLPLGVLGKVPKVNPREQAARLARQRLAIGGPCGVCRAAIGAGEVLEPGAVEVETEQRTHRDFSGKAQTVEHVKWAAHRACLDADPTWTPWRDAVPAAQEPLPLEVPAADDDDEQPAKWATGRW